MLGGAGFGPCLVRDGDNRGMQLPEGFRADQGRPAFAFAGIPAGPGGEIEDGHMGDAGGSEHGRIVAVGAGQEGLGAAVDLDMA